MDSLIHQLMSEALDPKVATDALLRKAMVVAKKLKVLEMETWIRLELNGYYRQEKEIPPYRILSGRLQGNDPYNGWLPVHGPKPEAMAALSKRNVAQSISELQQIADSDSDQVYVPVTAQIHDLLNRNNVDKTEFAQFFSKSQLHGILNTVKNMVLDWALKLDEMGIVGDGFVFTQKEQNDAHNVTINVGKVGNLIGTMTNSQIQQESSNSTQSILVSIPKRCQKYWLC
jgi:hypothetical protein